MHIDHSIYMRRALRLAESGRGLVHPNPLVGCVIVKNGKIIAQGAHTFFGGPHAEITALRHAGTKARGATLYLTLEPCTHWGKTPPCAPALIDSGIKRAFIAMKDPNPKVNGTGIKALKRAGIEVQVGLEEAAARRLNAPFITAMVKKRPYVILKMAMSLDGKIATAKGESKWISSLQARAWVHRMRSESDAVLVGANTAIHDNPSLTSHGQGRNPIRIVLDPQLRTPASLKIYNDQQASTWIVTDSRNHSKAKKLELKGVKILRNSLKFRYTDMTKLMKELTKSNVNQLFIEGGGETSWSFVQHGLIDEVAFFIAPLLVGGDSAKTPVEGLGFAKIKQALRMTSWTSQKIGPDLLIRGWV